MTKLKEINKILLLIIIEELLCMAFMVIGAVLWATTGHQILGKAFFFSSLALATIFLAVLIWAKVRKEI